MSQTEKYYKATEEALLHLLKDEANKHCADCGLKGVFLCIRCGGLHRTLGSHISKVKSITLDKWTEEQVQFMKSRGNSKVNAELNPHPERHPFPSNANELERFIRDKYERQLFRASPSDASRKLASNTHSVTDSTASHMDKVDYLREMGFADPELVSKTLKATNGNVQDALDVLLSTTKAATAKTRQKAESLKSLGPATADLLDIEFNEGGSAPLAAAQSEQSDFGDFTHSGTCDKSGGQRESAWGPSGGIKKEPPTALQPSEDVFDSPW